MKNKILFMIIICLLSLRVVFAENQIDQRVNTVNYNLKIGEKYEESIVAIFPKDAFKIAEEDDSDIPPLEYIFLYEKQYPMVSNLNVEYDKNIKRYDDRVIVTLSYTYTKDEFKKNTFLNNCFENFDINETDDYTEYVVKGKFYCLHDKRFNINVTTDSKVLSNNGNSNEDYYNWVVEKNNVDINLKLSNIDEESVNKEKSSVIFIIVILIVVFLIISLLIKNVKVKKVNY